MTAQVHYRLTRACDAPAVAALHAESWQRHYRGAYSDAFLDGDVVAERAAVWTQRLREPEAGQFTIVAESAGLLAGFVHTILDADPVWGSLVDNLHVDYDRSEAESGVASWGRRCRSSPSTGPVQVSIFGSLSRTWRPRASMRPRAASVSSVV